MKKLGLIFRASVREQFRWARQHLYTLLILSPLVAGISYLTVSRIASEVPVLRISFIAEFIFLIGFELSLLGISLSRASAEIYHLRKPESVLDSLPVSSATQFHAALVKRIARTIVIAALLLIVRALLRPGQPITRELLIPLLLFVVLTALAELFSALCWIHWGHTRNKLVGISALVSLTCSAMFAGVMIFVFLRPEYIADRNRLWLFFLSCVWIVALYLLTRGLHKHWRSSDIEYAKRIEAGGRLKVFHSSLLLKYFKRDVAVQLARDIQLTLRAFSSAVYVSLFIALLLITVLVTVLTTDWLPPASLATGLLEATWLPEVIATKVVCVLATTSCSILVAVLVMYQLPHFWLERASGATGTSIWEAKLWYARLISMPVPLIVWLICVFLGGVPLFYALPLLLECLWVWFIVSSLIGALAFEVPDRPEIAIILMLSFGSVFGLFVAIFWPIGLALFVMNGMRGLACRGQSRAAFCLLTEGD